MDTAKPHYAFLGEWSGPLAREVGDLVAPVSGPSLDDEHGGLLVDGRSAGDVDPQMLAAVLDSGRVLALAHPTEDLLSKLVDLTGQRPLQESPLVICSRGRAGSGYACLAGSDSDGASVPLLSHLADFGSFSAGDGTQLLPGPGYWDFAAGTQQLMVGTRWGWTAQPVFVKNGNYVVDCKLYPSDADGTVTDGPWQVYVYAYWVNGEKPPYYVLIVEEQAGIGLAQIAVTQPASYGYFQGQILLLPTTVADHTGSEITDGLTLIDHAPKTATDEVDVSLQVPMTLFGDTEQSNDTAFPFTATVAGTLDYEGWAVVDRTSSNAPAWDLHQEAPWNPSEVWSPWPSDPTICFRQFDAPDAAFDSSGNVIVPPLLSRGAITYRTVSAWRLDPPLFTPATGADPQPPPALTVRIQSQGVIHLCAIVHDSGGCYYGRRHLYADVASFPTSIGCGAYDWEIDVQKVASQKLQAKA